MRILALGAGAVVPAAFTVLAAWAAVTGNGPGLVAASLLAAIGWTVWGFAAWVVPAMPSQAKRRGRARWTPAEKAVLDDTTRLKGLLDSLPRREEKR